MEFVLHMLIVKESIIMILLFIIFASAIIFAVGNIAFEIEFKRKIKA